MPTKKKYITKQDVLFYFQAHADAVYERTRLPIWHFEPETEKKYRYRDPGYMFCVVLEVHVLDVYAEDVTDSFMELRRFIDRCSSQMHCEIVDAMPHLKHMDIPLEVAGMVNAFISVWNKYSEREELVA